MKKEKFEEKIADFLKGKLNSDEQSKLLEELSQEDYAIDEITNLKNLYDSIDEINVPEPSSEMDDKFYDMLYSHKTKKKSISMNDFMDKNKVYLQIAASITLFILGWFGGIYFSSNLKLNSQFESLQNEMSAMKKMVMLTMMEQPSPTERIKAVNMVNEINNVDNKVFEALIKTLNEDENDNVRLVALEALKIYANNPKVREGLIQSISKQTSPLIQLELANVMVELQEKRSLPYFKNLLNDKELNYSVRKKVDEVVNILI